MLELFGNSPGILKKTWMKISLLEREGGRVIRYLLRTRYQLPIVLKLK
jgi:hypothetical protein